eukprot:6217830-Prymnesium_polylepis.1
MGDARGPCHPPLLCMNCSTLLQDLERVLDSHVVAVGCHALGALHTVLAHHLLVIDGRELALLVLEREVVEGGLDLCLGGLRLDAGLVLDELQHRLIRRAGHLGAQGDMQASRSSFFGGDSQVPSIASVIRALFPRTKCRICAAEASPSPPLS